MFSVSLIYCSLWIFLQKAHRFSGLEVQFFGKYFQMMLSKYGLITLSCHTYFVFLFWISHKNLNANNCKRNSLFPADSLYWPSPFVVFCFLLISLVPSYCLPRPPAYNSVFSKCSLDKSLSKRFLLLHHFIQNPICTDFFSLLSFKIPSLNNHLDHFLSVFMYHLIFLMYSKS